MMTLIYCDVVDPDVIGAMFPAAAVRDGRKGVCLLTRSKSI